MARLSARVLVWLDRRYLRVNRSRQCSHLGCVLNVPWAHLLLSRAAILDAIDVLEGRPGARFQT